MKGKICFIRHKQSFIYSALIEPTNEYSALIYLTNNNTMLDLQYGNNK